MCLLDLLFGQQKEAPSGGRNPQKREREIERKYRKTLLSGLYASQISFFSCFSLNNTTKEIALAEVASLIAVEDNIGAISTAIELSLL